MKSYAHLKKQGANGAIFSIFFEILQYAHHSNQNFTLILCVVIAYFKTHCMK